MKNQILFVKKQDISIDRPLLEQEVISTFERSNDMEEIKNAVQNAEDRMVVTWASVDMKDLAGESIPIDDLINQQDILLERNGPISDAHTNKIVGNTKAYKVMEHPETGTLGVLHLDKIFNHNPVDQTVWEEIVSGERKGSSVGGVNAEVSFGTDKVTGEPVRVLEGFSHMETASVVDPCNPLSLNEAFSVVAKSNSQKEENDINKLNNKIDRMNNQTIKGDNMSTNVEKSISELTNAVSKVLDIAKANAESIAKLKKAEDEPSEEEKPSEEDKKKEEEEIEEKKKAEEEIEDKKKEEEEEKKKAEEEIEDKKKEEAASDIDGETDAPAPDSPEQDQSNDKDVFKKAMASVDKKVAAEVKKAVASIASTPRPGAMSAQDVSKSNEFSKLPLDIATGKKSMRWVDVNKANDEHEVRMEGQ